MVFGFVAATEGPGKEEEERKGKEEEVYADERGGGRGSRTGATRCC